MLEFGELFIDEMELITNNNLYAYNDQNRKVFSHKKVPSDIINLLMSKKPKGDISEKSKEIYRKLVKASKKRDLNKQQQKILLIDTPEKALERLTVLFGLQKAGDNNRELRNDMAILSDYLHKKDLLTKMYDICGSKTFKISSSVELPGLFF